MAERGVVSGRSRFLVAAPAHRRWLADILHDGGMEAECVGVGGAAELQAALASGPWDALLAEFGAAGPIDTAGLLELTAAHAGLPVILLTTPEREPQAVEWLRHGIWDVVRRDCAGRLLPALRRALHASAQARELQVARVRWRHLVENIGQGLVLLDAGGVILLANAALERMFGYAMGELVGQPVEVLVAGERRAAHADGRLNCPPRPAPPHLWPCGRIEGRRKDSSLFPVEIALSPYQEEGHTVVLATVDDISARAQIERELYLIASVFEMREGILVTDRNNRILRVNRAFSEITGYSEGEVLGKNPAILQSGRQGPEFYRDMWQMLQREGRWAGEIQNRHKNGRIYPEWLTITAIRDGAGEISHYVGVFTDLTMQKQAEKAVAANAAKSEFLANMSHEIRTPMNGVVGMTDILQETALTQEQRRMVRTIRDSALSLLGILDDILDFSKIEAGKLALETAPTSLRDVAEEVARLLVPNAGARDIDFHVYVDPALPQWVMADPLRLRQIMYNLLGNALKFTQGDAARHGMVALRVESCPGGDSPPACRIRVIDNGIGIAPEAIGHLFQPFTQADESTSRRFGGTGLGLSITKRLVSLMQGSVTVRSAPGEGTEFTVTLPLQEAYAGQRLPELVSLQGLRVLAVTADARCAEALQAYLCHAGAEVCVAPDLDAARQHMRQPEPWSLLVLETPWPEQAAQEAGFASLPWVQLCRPGSLGENLPGRVCVHQHPLFYRELLNGVALASGRLTVPELVARSERRLHPRAAPPNPRQAAAAGTLVLVAEDNETNREVIQQQLRLLGYASEAVGDGRSALEHWRSGRYGMLLTDYHMPGMDGFQLTAAIRAEEPAGSHFPIVAVTANALQGEEERCLAAGMDGYLTKPVRLDALGRMMARWLPSALPLTLSGDAADDSLSVWDRQALTRLVGDQPGLHHSLLEKFVSHAEQHVASIVEAAACGEAALAGEVAHKLKSAARSVGAMALGAVCQGIEDAGRALDIEQVRRLCRVLDQAHAGFLQCLQEAGAL